MSNAPISPSTLGWQKQTLNGLLILALTFTAEWACRALTRGELRLALAETVVLAVTGVYALTPPKKPNAFLTRL